MASLDSRLSAYNQKPSLHKAQLSSLAVSPYTHTVQRYSEHPITGKRFELNPILHFDFTHSWTSSKILFFDIETTGLGFNENTFAFLIGCAHYQHDSSVAIFTSFFCESPADEISALKAFHAYSLGFDVLVSFNGKSFDIPLLMNRMRRNDLTLHFDHLHHVDFYHLIRRIFPEKPSRLIDAESRLLNFSRTNDISGAQVAQSYFEYVRFGNSTLRQKMLDHNLYDIATLVSLAGCIDEVYLRAHKNEFSWAYKIYLDKSIDPDQKRNLLFSKSASFQYDQRDYYIMGEIYQREKQFRKAIRLFCRSYRAGRELSLVKICSILKSRLRRARMAQSLAQWGLKSGTEKLQLKLLPFVKGA